MKRIQILAIIAAIFTVIMVYFFLGGVKEASQIPSASVVQSAVDIKANTEISAEMVKLVEIPETAVTQNAMTTIESVVGKVSTGDIYTGEQIIASKLAEPGVSTKELSYLVEPGKRAVTVAVDAVSGIAGLIEPGNKVDVIVVYDESNVAGTILENIPVLSVGKRMTSGASVSLEDVYETVTLSLDPAQSLKIRQAEAKGTISMALRSYLEK